MTQTRLTSANGNGQEPELSICAGITRPEDTMFVSTGKAKRSGNPWNDELRRFRDQGPAVSLRKN